MIAFKIVCLVFMAISGLGAVADEDKYFGKYGAIFFMSGLLFLGALIINLWV